MPVCESEEVLVSGSIVGVEVPGSLVNVAGVVVPSDCVSKVNTCDFKVPSVVD